MATFDGLQILKVAESLADDIWQLVLRLSPLEREVVGGQIARAADSVGANIAEAYGRFHFGEKLQFLYYARGSLFETEYWINRVQARQLIQATEAQRYADRLDTLARQLNTFASGLKTVRKTATASPPSIREETIPYLTEPLNTPESTDLINEAQQLWLQQVN
ncbi:MAG: four helix bundle protein [Chloroflexota bacterium]|nr:four helix bundle protein [Chloroflexota bacterium]